MAPNAGYFRSLYEGAAGPCAASGISAQSSKPLPAAPPAISARRFVALLHEVAQAFVPVCLACVAQAFLPAASALMPTLLGFCCQRRSRQEPAPALRDASWGLSRQRLSRRAPGPWPPFPVPRPPAAGFIALLLPPPEPTCTPGCGWRPRNTSSPHAPHPRRSLY